MKKREAAGSSSVRTFIRGAYKAFSFWCGKLKTRLLLRAKEERLSIVVYEKGIVREMII